MARENRFKDTEANRTRIEAVEELLQKESWLGDLTREDMEYYKGWGYSERQAKISTALSIGY